MPNYDIISIGAATVDILVKSTALSLHGKFLRLPSSSKNEINHCFIGSGGGATNSSVAFSRLGLKSACVSLLGRDPFSGYISSDLKNDKVNSELLIQKKTESTDFSIIFVDNLGGRSILTNRGDSRLESRHVPWSKITAPRWFYITSLEGNINLLEHLIGFAKENNIKIALNPGQRELQNRLQLIPLLAYVDFLLLNRVEAETLTALRFDAANFWPRLVSYGAKITAVTDGRHGAYVGTSTDRLYSPIINRHPVDETGAGDSFGSAFVAALLYGKKIETALSWGMKNSASVVGHLGSKPGLLTLSQIRTKRKSTLHHRVPSPTSLRSAFGGEAISSLRSPPTSLRPFFSSLRGT